VGKTLGLVDGAEEGLWVGVSLGFKDGRVDGVAEGLLVGT